MKPSTSKSKGKKSRTIIGEPLTPSVVAAIGGTPHWPPPCDGFDPCGNWSAAWRIWTCHGYRNSGNSDRGFLKITRTAAKAGKPFTLNVRQEVLHTAGMLQRVTAEIICRDDAIASPDAWTLTSRFFRNGKEKKDLFRNQEGKRSNGKAITGDWCLFEALQRTPPQQGAPLTFDILEGMTTCRRGQHLAYQDKETFTTGGKSTVLRRYRQLGDGLLPYEYWLDEHDRLVMAVTLSRAYVLDPKADPAKGAKS